MPFKFGAFATGLSGGSVEPRQTITSKGSNGALTGRNCFWPSLLSKFILYPAKDIWLLPGAKVW